MKKIKLPRKRKKAFKKAHDRHEYMMAQILGEILQEENRPHAERFYSYRKAKTKEEYRSSHNGMVVTKRW